MKTQTFEQLKKQLQKEETESLEEVNEYLPFDYIFGKIEKLLVQKRQDLIELITCGGTPESQSTRWQTVVVLDALIEEFDTTNSGSST